MQKNISKYIKSFTCNRSRNSKDKDLHLQALQQLSIHDENCVNNIKNNKIMLEIGSGQGHFTTHFAKINQDYQCIACEVYEQGNINAIKKIKKENIENIKFWRNDARLLLEKLPDQSIDIVFILFPDPWPKKKHQKRRIVQQELIALLRKKVKVNSTVIIASDHEDYQGHITQVLSESKIAFQVINENNFTDNDFSYTKTRYHKKAIEENRKSLFFVIQIP